MRREARKERTADEIIAAATRGELSEQEVDELFAEDPSLARLAFLAMLNVIRQQQEDAEADRSNLNGSEARSEQHAPADPSTPSGAIPVHAKRQRSKRGRKKPGAKRGHRGRRRPKPNQPDHRHRHKPLTGCPQCEGPVHRSRQSRRRTIEEIPKEGAKTEATEHEIPRHWCARCRDYVEPTVVDAMPGATLGHRIVALTAWLHYGLGVTISHVVAILQYHLQTKLTAGGLVAMWQRLALVLGAWYDQIGEEARQSSYLHADETGWRVDGQRFWLWAFANPRLTYFMIDPTRGSPAVLKFLSEYFDGVLLRDFWAAYDVVMARDHQCCLVHLLRELVRIDQRNTTAEWQAFVKKLRRLIADAVGLRARDDFCPERYRSRIRRIDQRLQALARTESSDADVARIAERLRRYQDSLFTFLDYPEIPWENNFGERQIRPAVIIRKNSQGNRSEHGAEVQAVLMTVFQTLKMRGHNPIETVVSAMREYVRTGSLPALPD